MNEILREIRAEYEQIAIKNRDEAEDWYKVFIFYLPFMLIGNLNNPVIYGLELSIEDLFFDFPNLLSTIIEIHHESCGYFFIGLFPSHLARFWPLIVVAHYLTTISEELKFCKDRSTVLFLACSLTVHPNLGPMQADSLFFRNRTIPGTFIWDVFSIPAIF